MPKANSKKKKSTTKQTAASDMLLKFKTENGIRVFLEEDDALPLVNIELVLLSGAHFDTQGKEGTSRLFARMLRMGSGRQKSHDFEAKIDSLGAALSIQVTHSFISFSATVIQRNLQEFLALFASMFLNPALRASDLRQLKRESLAEIVESRDNDQSLAVKAFRRSLFGQHPYGRSILGSEKSIRSIQIEDIKRRFKKHVCASNMLLGVSGDIRPSELRALLKQDFLRIDKGVAPQKKIQPPKQKTGRHLLIIDKPERTQTQIVIGTLGSHAKDHDHIALHVANTAFGGTFTARLMREIRSKRGWSYGASSRLGHDRQREAWWMWTFPAMDDAVECIKVQWDLYTALVEKGISKKELDFAKDYLMHSHAFDIDTAQKRVDQSLDAVTMGLAPSFHDHYVARIKAVSLKDANNALKRRLSQKNVTFNVVATASKIQKELKDLPIFDSVKIVPFDKI